MPDSSELSTDESALVPAFSSPLQFMLQFQEVQTRRARYYNLLHQGFKSYLGNFEEGTFSELLKTVTSAFQACSQQVITLEHTLIDDCGRPDLAALLRSIQEHEREKLKLTLSLQLLKRTQALKLFDWQHVDKDDPGFDPLEPHHVCSHGTCGHQHTHGAGSQAVNLGMTEADFKLLMSETMLGIDEVVVSINDALEEVKYAVSELSTDDDKTLP